MKSRRTAGRTITAKPALRTLVCLAVLAAAFTAPAQAQTAAQRAALAHLDRRPVPQFVGPPPNGVEATGVTLDQPGGVAFDPAGDIYIADTGDNVVLEVTIAGIVNTVAGNGQQGFAGDGGPATSAQLNSPASVAVDSNGNLYIADAGNNRVREVSGGTIATIAGAGAAGFSGDGGAATSAELDQPTAVAVDSKGDIYIADTNNNRIREIGGGTIQTVAGDGVQTYSGDGGLATAAGLNSPTGVAVDAAFNIYIGDTANQAVRMVTFSTGIITTIAGTGVTGFNGDGPATSSALASPAGVAVDSSGNVYVADSNNNRIREIGGGNITTIAGSGAQGFSDFTASTNALLNSPLAVAVLNSTIAFADTLNNNVGLISSGTDNTVAGTAASGPESLVLGGPISTVYGTGTVTAAFSNNGLTGTGLVTFYDGEGASPVMVAQTSLSANAAVLNTSTLAVGTHYIIASYAGDSKNPAISSAVFVLAVTPAPLIAVANSVDILYGQGIPALTGTLSGALPQDAGNFTAVYSTTATSTSPPGAYPITVKLTGSAAANYSVTLGSGSGSVVIAKAPTTTSLAVSATPILGVPVTLTATVASTTTGTPAGTVIFFNGVTQLNSAPAVLSGGVATFTTSTLQLGAISLTAVYSGDTDFITSTSTAYTATEISPDFSMSATPGTQSVLPTQSVSYSVTLTPVNPTFVYPVSLSASGLPSGVTATFNPSSIAAGAGTSSTMLTLNASSLARLQNERRPWGGLGSSLALLLLPLVFGKRTRRAAAKLSRASRLLIVLLALAAAAGVVTGCGSGGFFGHSTNTYTVTVTAVSGSETHTVSVNLTVQ